MTTEPTWWAQVEFDAPGWLLLSAAPSRLAEQQEWLTEAVDEVASSWNDAWAFEDRRPICSALSAMLSNRLSGTALDLVFVPPDVPLVARVTVQIGEAVPIAAWEAAGFYVSIYDDSRLGPGLQCTEEERIVGTDETLSLVQVDYVFTDGTYMVVASVEQTEAQLFAAMIPGLQQILGGIAIQRPDGEQFQSVPIESYTPGPEDFWKVDSESSTIER